MTASHIYITTTIPYVNAQPHLRHAIESGPLRIEPDGRRNEVLSFIDGGLEDFSISRSVSRAAVSAFPCPVTPVR
jgi:methionyl-tRNA synthetase